MKPIPAHHVGGPSSLASAFSLIEVVLAIGIVAFALLTTIGLFGGIMRTSGDNSQRREMSEAVDSLRSFLNGTNFDTAYGWAKSGKDFLYVTYKSASNGAPDAGAGMVAGKWIDPAVETTAPYEAARSGRWLRTVLGVSPSNPGGTNLPAASSYPGACLFVAADIRSIAAPGQTNAGSSLLQSTMAISR